MKRIVLFLFIFGSLSYARAQNDPRRIITGSIESSETSDPVSFVHVLNSTSNQGSTTDENGSFLIPVSAGDTLNFSAVGYEGLQYIVGEQTPGESASIQIAMNPSAVELDEVEVFAYRDAEALKDAILNLELPDGPEKVVIPGSYDGPRRAYKPNVMNPLSLAFGIFDKKSKERIKLADARQETLRWKQMKQKVDFIRETAELEEEEIDEFLQFCNLDYKKIEVSTEYELALAVNHCLKDYKESHSK